MKVLCKIGLHRPLKIRSCLFIDVVSGKEVFESYCPCGKRWLTDSTFGWLGHKIQLDKSKEV